MKTCKSDIITLIRHLREKFGDKKLILTFSVNYSDCDIRGKRSEINVFSDKSIERLNTWLTHITLGQKAGFIESVSIIARRILEKNKESKKEIYHFLASKNTVTAFNQSETELSQTTDFYTKKRVLPEPGVVCRSSEGILSEITL
jgi:hypothetical protein